MAAQRDGLIAIGDVTVALHDQGTYLIMRVTGIGNPLTADMIGNDTSKDVEFRNACAAAKDNRAWFFSDRTTYQEIACVSDSGADQSAGEKRPTKYARVHGHGHVARVRRDPESQKWIASAETDTEADFIAGEFDALEQAHDAADRAAHPEGCDTGRCGTWMDPDQVRAARR